MPIDGYEAQSQQSLPPETARSVDKLCDAFEQDWVAGQQPRIEEYLARLPDVPWAAMLSELLLAELELRQRDGQAPRIDEYLARFGQHESVVRGVFQQAGIDQQETSQSGRSGSDTVDWIAPVDPSSPTVPRDPHQTLVPRRVSPKKLRLPCRFGNYELVEELGVGGMGIVYRAHQIGTPRYVALKLIRPDHLSGFSPEARDDALARFRREVQAAAQLEHDHVVTVYDVGEIDGQLYYAMRLVDGESLRELIEENPLEPKVAARYAQQVATALAAAHAQGILHRDLKPHNVLLDRHTDRAMLTDFGLAKLIEGDQQLTATQSVMGSPPYMSPEQTSDAKLVTEASDVYGLGATLYHLLTGRPPFQAANATATMIQVQTEAPVGPRVLNAAVPRDLETITLKCLEKEPGKRYAKAQEIADELERFLRDEPIYARPRSRAVRAWLWCKRHPAVATGCFLTVLIVAALTFAGVVSLKWRHTETERRLAEEKRVLLAAEQRRTAEALAKAEASYKQEAHLRAQVVELSYLHEVTIAHREWRDANVGRASKLLKGCPKSARGWEWDYVRRLCSPELVNLSGHEGNISSVAWSRTGKYIATASSDGTIRLWNAESGKEIRRWTGLGSGAWGVAISPDGSVVAGCGRKPIVLVWDTADGRELKRLEGFGAPVNAVAFSPDGKWLACGPGTILRPGVESGLPAPAIQEVRVYDWRTAEVVYELRGHTRSITTVAFSPTGSLLASAGWDSLICLWDMATGKLQRELRGHRHNIRGLAFSSDSQRLASSCEGRMVRLWSVATGDIMWTLDDWHAGVNDIAFSSDGQILACISSDQTIRIMESVTGKTRLTLRGHTGWGLGLAFSPDDRRLVSVGADRVGKVWDVTRDPEALVFPGHAGWVNTVVFSPDSRYLATGAGGAVHLWEKTRERVKKLPTARAKAQSVAFSASGELLAAGCSDGVVRVWEVETAKTVHEWLAHSQEVRGVAFSPDGRLLATVGFDHRLCLWKLADQQLLSTLASGTRSVTFSPDGRFVAAAGDDGRVRIWEVATYRLAKTLVGHEGIVAAITFSRDGRRLVSGSYDRTARLWDVASGRQEWVFTGHGDAVLCVAFAPDGRRIATGSDDRLIKLVVSATGEEALNLSGHLGPVYAVSFSSDGGFLASGGWDGTARLWNGFPMRNAP